MKLLPSLIMGALLLLSKHPQSEVPVNGTYTYEVVFAEWGGKSLGDEIIVVVEDGHAALLISENSNAVWMGAKPGDLWEEGTLRKHKSGVWIISNDKSDVNLDEIGGCTGGPIIIDFEKRTVEMC
ncbi:MAG: hypothetical protein ACPGAJ_03945 [Schleiferiaceae bacterium]